MQDLHIAADLQQIPSYLRAPSGRRVLSRWMRSITICSGEDTCQSCSLLARFVAQDHTSAVRSTPSRSPTDRSDMRDHYSMYWRFDPASRPRDTFHPTLELPAFAMGVNQLQLRALLRSSVPALKLRRVAAIFSFARVHHHLDRAVDMLGVARIRRFEQGQLKVEFLRLIGDGRKSFGGMNRQTQPWKR